MATVPRANQVRSAFSDDPEMRTLLETYIAQMPARIDALAKAWSDDQTDELSRLAHQLKGTGAGHGFGAISSAAASLESALEEAEARTQEIRNALNGLVDLCARAAI
jgi:HPt (histidine-containing phosphotransfer) domain-containing protein